MGSRCHVLSSRTRFWQYRGRRSHFHVLRSGLVFDDTVGVGSRFHVLCARTLFWLYRGRRVPFTCFTLTNSFPAVPMAAGPVFMFYAPGLVFGGTVGVGSRFHVLPSRTRFWRYRGLPIPFSCFALPDSFSTVPRASGPFFMFCAPGLVFGGTEGVVFLFHVFYAWTRFWRYRGRRIPFSFFARPDSCSASTEGVGSRFHVLRARTHFWRYRGRRIPFSSFVLPD
jgi:ribosomal protein L32